MTEYTFASGITYKVFCFGPEINVSGLFSFKNMFVTTL